MMDFVSKMMNLTEALDSLNLKVFCSKHDELCIKNDEFRI